MSTLSWSMSRLFLLMSWRSSGDIDAREAGDHGHVGNAPGSKGVSLLIRNPIVCVVALRWLNAYLPYEQGILRRCFCSRELRRA